MPMANHNLLLVWGWCWSSESIESIVIKSLLEAPESGYYPNFAVAVYCGQVMSVAGKTKSLTISVLVIALGVAWAMAKPPAQRNYLDILRVFWSEVYPDGGNTLYCNQQFAPFDRKVNVEHVYPMSWVARSLKCGKRDQCRTNSSRFNFIESDMHNLYPARKDVNKTRGAYPFSMIKGERYIYKECDFEVDYKARKVEPAPEARGRIARAMLYMADEYGLDIYNRQRSMLQEWNRRYPPDEEERRRNRVIERIQGNGNPYIE